MPVRTQLAVALAATIVISIVLLSTNPRIPSALAQYSWTDNIDLYEDVSVIHTDMRKITSNETVPVDVRVHLTLTDKIELLEYYILSANGTNFIIISKGNIVLSNNTYYELETGQTLWFNVEAEGASSLSVDHIAKIGVKVEFWSAEYAIPGDVDVDGDVDSDDLFMLAAAFGTSPPSNPNCDINQDGVVDVRDLYILGRNYGRTD